MSRTALYRHFDASGRLLYVGITDCLSERDRRHRATASWHGEVVRTETQWCLSREHAADLERVAIRHEKPLHNVSGVAAAQVEPINISAETKSLIDSIASFCAAYGIAETRFGTMAVKDPSFVSDLRAGRELRRKTVQKVASFIAAHSASVQ